MEPKFKKIFELTEEERVEFKKTVVDAMIAAKNAARLLDHAAWGFGIKELDRRPITEARQDICVAIDTLMKLLDDNGM